MYSRKRKYIVEEPDEEGQVIKRPTYQYSDLINYGTNALTQGISYLGKRAFSALKDNLSIGHRLFTDRNFGDYILQGGRANQYTGKPYRIEQPTPIAIEQPKKLPYRFETPPRKSYTKPMATSFYNYRYSHPNSERRTAYAPSYFKTFHATKPGQGELKNHDTTFSNITVTTSTAIQDLCAIAQGDTVLTRDANKILIVGFKVRVIFNPGATDDSNWIRFMIMQSRHTPLILTDLPQNAIDYPDTNKMKVWKDFVIPLWTTGDNTGRKVTYKDFYIRVNQYCYYEGAASTDVIGNNFVVGYVSSSAANGPTLNGCIRTLFREV